MLRKKDLNKELVAIDSILKDEKVDQITLTRVMIKAITLLVKVARDIKINQILDLKNKGIKFDTEEQDNVKEKQ